MNKPPRRAPQQERSEQTLASLFAATAQILQNEGERALTTNRIAQVAGFSVGTLYQYFANKDLLLQAMAQRMRQQVMNNVDAYFDQLEQRPDLPQLDPQAVVQEVLTLIVNSMLGPKGYGKPLLRLYWLLEEADHTTQAVTHIAMRLALFFERAQPHLAIKNPGPSELFVLTRAVLGTIRSASLERSSLLGSPQMITPLRQMAWGLLGPG